MNMTELNDKPKLNDVVLRKLQYKIYFLERDNHKTKKHTDADMVQKIRKVIDEAVRSEEDV